MKRFWAVLLSLVVFGHCGCRRDPVVAPCYPMYYCQPCPQTYAPRACTPVTVTAPATTCTPGPATYAPSTVTPTYTSPPATTVPPANSPAANPPSLRQ
jgi:hypothetical protein